MRISSLKIQGGFVPIFLLRQLFFSVKTQNPQLLWSAIPISLFLFGDNRSLRFSVRELLLMSHNEGFKK